jgi:hypothetical protein
MNKAKFPVRKTDGSFCVEIGLSAAPGAIMEFSARVQTWILTDWMPYNSIWKREWRTGNNLQTVDEQVLNFEDEFIGAPEVIGFETSVLQLRVFGKASAKFWKDWLILKFLPDLRATFPEVGNQLYMRDCGR